MCSRCATTARAELTAESRLVGHEWRPVPAQDAEHRTARRPHWGQPASLDPIDRVAVGDGRDAQDEPIADGRHAVHRIPGVHRVPRTALGLGLDVRRRRATGSGARQRLADPLVGIGRSVPIEAHDRGGQRHGGDDRLVRDVVRLPAERLDDAPGRPGRADPDQPGDLGRPRHQAGEVERLPTAGRAKAVDRARIHLEPRGGAGDVEGRLGAQDRPVEHERIGQPADVEGLEDRALLADLALDARIDAGKERSVGRGRTRARQCLEHGDREHPAIPSVARDLLGELERVARAQRDVRRSGDGDGTGAGQEVGHQAGGAEFANVVAGVGRRFIGVRQPLTDPGTGVTRPSPRMAAVEQCHHVRPLRGDLAEQDRELLVRDRPDQDAIGAAPPRIDADEGLDPPGRLECGEGPGDRFLAPVSAVREERHVAGGGLPEMRAHRVDDRLARRVTVEQGHQSEPLPEPALEERGQVADVIAATGQPGDGWRVGVDPDEQGVHGTSRGHGASHPLSSWDLRSAVS